MDSLFHLVFAFIAGMAVNAKLRHEPLWIAALAFSAVFIDIDHLLFTFPRALHTVFVVWAVPAALFVLAWRREAGTEHIRLRTLVILLFVMLNGHLIADLLSGGALRPLYPLSNWSVAIPTAWSVSVIHEHWYLVSPDGIALTAYALIIGAAYYAEEAVYFAEKRHESLRSAFKDALAA